MAKDTTNALDDLLTGSVKTNKKKDDSKPKKKYKIDYENLPKSTTTMSFRVPFNEKERLEQVFAEKEGLTLAQGLKKAVYEYIQKYE